MAGAGKTQQKKAGEVKNRTPEGSMHLEGCDPSGVVQFKKQR